jgi:hypothetical protein
LRYFKAISTGTIVNRCRGCHRQYDDADDGLNDGR